MASTQSTSGQNTGGGWMLRTPTGALVDRAFDPVPARRLHLASGLSGHAQWQRE